MVVQAEALLKKNPDFENNFECGLPILDRRFEGRTNCLYNVCGGVKRIRREMPKNINFQPVLISSNSTQSNAVNKWCNMILYHNMSTLVTRLKLISRNAYVKHMTERGRAETSTRRLRLE